MSLSEWNDRREEERREVDITNEPEEEKPRWWSEPDNYGGPTFREDDSG